MIMAMKIRMMMMVMMMTMMMIMMMMIMMMTMTKMRMMMRMILMIVNNDKEKLKKAILTIAMTNSSIRKCSGCFCGAIELFDAWTSYRCISVCLCVCKAEHMWLNE